MKKRIISLFTALVIGCTTVIMPVFADAAADVSGICTFDNYNPSSKFDLPENWLDKNGYTEPDNDDIKGKEKTGTELYAKKGVFGKPSNDTAYDINTLYRTPDKSYISQWYDTRYNIVKNLDGRRYIKASSEVAIDGFRSTRFISINFYNGTAKKFATIDRLVEMVPGSADGDYTLKIGGEISDYAIPNNKWMKFDFVLDTATRKADVYINGALVKSGVDFKIAADFSFEGARLNLMIFGQHAVTIDGTKGTYLAHTYLDNVSYLLTDTKPTVDKYTAPDVIDFQNYNGGELPQGYDYKEGKYQPFKADQTNTNQTYLKYEGLRGKNQADISWRINAPEGKNNSDEYQNYRWKTNMDVSTNNTGFVKFSTEFCMEGASMTRGIALKTTHTNGWADTDLIKIEYKNGKQVVTVGGGISQNNNTDKTNFSGQIKTIDLPMSVVMKIDAVINRTKCTFDLYINGKEVATDVSMGTSYIAQVEEVILYAQQKWVGNDVWEGVYGSRNCFPASETYFDTMELGRYYSYPTVEPYTSPSVTVMSKYNETLTPIDSGKTGKTYGHWVPLRGYDSKYYYYAENVTMPNDNATRTYKATFGKATINNAKDTTITTNDNLIEVKNGKVKIYGKEITATVPTNEQFKLSFLFDVLNKSYNVYVNDEAIAVNIKFDTNNSGKPITEFSSIENTVKAEGEPATVSIEPVASGAFTKLPEYAKVCDLTKGESKINAKMLSQYISGRMILAVYGKDGVLKNVQIGDGNTKTLEADAADTDTAKLMLWDLGDMTPVIRAVEIK